MASSVGQISFGVGIDANALSAQLRLAVEPAVAAVQRELNRNPLKVKLDIDTATAVQAAQRSLDRANLHAKVKVDVDTFGAEAQIREITRNSNNRTIKIKVDVDLTEAQIKDLRAAGAAIRRLESKDIKVTLDSNITEAQIKAMRSAASAIRRLESKDVRVNFSTNLTEDQARSLSRTASAIRRLESKTITIRVNIQADEARLRALAEVLRNLRDRNLNVGVRADHGPVERLARALGSLTKYASIAAGVAAAIAAIGGAAGAALGAVGGLVAGLAAVGGALAGIGATAVVGFQGVGDAFKALSSITENAASEAKTQAKAVASASNALESAQQGAEDAAVSLTRAQEDQVDAAKDVAKAYETAQRKIDGYAISLKEANLDEREAALALVEARTKLDEVNRTSADPKERIKATLDVERAEINLEKARKANKETQEDVAKAEAKGIDQSDEVVAAKKQQKNADEAAADAAKNLARANEAVAEAAQNLSDAQNASTTSADKFAQAMANLSPEAQNVVRAYQAAKPALDEFRKSIQDTLFTNLGPQFTETLTAILPTLQERMGGVAAQLNLAAQNAFEFLRSAEGMRALNVTFLNGEMLLKGLTSGTGEFTKGMIDLQAAALPAMEGIGRAIASVGEGIGRAFTRSAESGQLTKVFEGFSATLTGLGSGLDHFIGGLLTMAEKVLPTLGPFFDTFGKTIEAIAPSLGNLGAIFVNSLTELLPYLGDFIKALADGLGPVLPVIARLIGTFMQALTPLIEPLSKFAVILGETFISVLEKLSPAIEPLANAFVALLEAVAPILPMLAELAAEIIIALAPALTEIFKAAAPVIQIFVDEFTPILKQMAPVLAEVAMTLGKAIADALIELAPLLPPLIEAWGNLLLAVAPLLPELAELVAEILPPLVDILVALTPIIVKVAELFTWLVRNIIEEIVIPIINRLTEMWSDAGDKIETVTSWLTDTVFPGLGAALDKVKGWFGDAVDWIGSKWDELRDKAAVPVNYVIDTVWNNGLLRAWNSIDGLLGGVLPDAQPLQMIPRRAAGGPLGYMHGGTGNGTADDMLFWGSNYEHVLTASNVMKAGGHDVIYAIRDMIERGIAFTWDNGRIVSELGKDNLQRYGAAVRQQGFGNVDPQGLFDTLATVPIPQFNQGGPIFPWMYQLARGHDFAKAQDGRPYKWAGPQFVGDSFDCSGFMGSIIAAIQGSNTWQRYWATASFAGYPQVGAQGLTKGLLDGVGMIVGITDDPGGAGGGHTAGELRAIPELGIPAARVESGGAIGNVHYGRGTNPLSFASLYGLPIGANGFFQPTPGGDSNGPSVESQNDFINKAIQKMVKAATDPIREQIINVVGAPPPALRALPTAVLDTSEKAFVSVAGNAVGNLGGLVGSVWQRAQGIGERVLDLVNPFDDGGIATGTGFMPKNIIDPERVLSPEQTRLFATLVAALATLAKTSTSSLASVAQNVTVDISTASVEALHDTFSTEQELAQRDTQDVIERTASSQEEVAAREAAAQREQLLGIASRLGGDVLGPIMASAVDAGIGALNGWIEGLGDEVVKAVNNTTKAVNNLGSVDASTTEGILSTPTRAAFGMPGSAFDFYDAVSTAVGTIASAATSAFNKVRDDIVNAALAQTPSRVGNSRGRLGEDISGGFLTDLIVRLTGVEIEILDLLENTYEEIQSFREGAFTGFSETGELMSDTAALIQRNQSSIELAAAEQERIQKALIKAVIKYLITSVLIPIITAILGAMITLATTAIGAAIGSAIPIIGTAIGAAVGAAVGAALSGLAAVFTSLLAVGAGAALDAFDSGGLAYGKGYMPKDIIGPERVLSERQTSSFEQLVNVLDRSTGNRTVQIGSMNLHGVGSPQAASDSLLTYLNSP